MTISLYFSKYATASAAKYCKKEAVNKSASSAASRDYAKFQAMIKSAANAASRKPKIQGSAPRPSPASRAFAQALPWILGFPEAALAADLITA